jgi:hypothetical protein
VNQSDHRAASADFFNGIDPSRTSDQTETIKKTHRLLANVDTALEQQVRDLAKR